MKTIILLTIFLTSAICYSQVVPAYTVETGSTSYFVQFSNNGGDCNFYPAVDSNGVCWDYPIEIHAYRIYTYKYYPEYVAEFYLKELRR